MICFLQTAYGKLVLQSLNLLNKQNNSEKLFLGSTPTLSTMKSLNGSQSLKNDRKFSDHRQK